MNIRIAGIEVSIPRKSFEIYVQGCYRKCPGCHNPDTQPFGGGKEVDSYQFLQDQWYKLIAGYELIDNIYITGGDLLCQPEEVAKEFSMQVFSFLPYDDYYIWLFTGCREEDLPSWVWDYYDIVKCGEYREDMLNPPNTFPASKNQKLLFNGKRKGSLQYKFDTIEFSGEKRWHDDVRIENKENTGRD